MKNIEYKYQNYNKKYFFAEAIIAQYVNSMNSIKNKSYNDTDISFVRSFEPVTKRLLEDHKDKSAVWMYILFNEFPRKAKTCIKKQIELSDAGLPISRASYYREVVLFTNLIAEYFGLGEEYFNSKKDIVNTFAPSPYDVKNYVITLNIT